MNRVLSVSCDASLLDTRERLLVHSGYEVVSALRLSHAHRLCRDGAFDLLLLCHTVPSRSKIDLIREFRKSSYGAVLALVADDEPPVPDSDYTFQAGRHPAELLALVSAIFTSRRRTRAAV